MGLIAGQCQGVMTMSESKISYISTGQNRSNKSHIIFMNLCMSLRQLHFEKWISQ